MPAETKKMLINVDGDETRIAVVTGNTLDNLHIEQTYENRIIGNIYYGKVVKIQSSFQAAFIDYGAERHGFLAFSDVNQQLVQAIPNFKGRPSIEKVLKTGQSVMVQVSRNEIGHKGASLTTNISLPGRFLVFMPNSDKGGVSKKIEDGETRTRLKHLLEGFCGEKDSAIIRTAGVNRSASELKRDFMVLRRKWNQILAQYENTSEPRLLYEEEDVVVRTLRDYFIEDIGEIWIDHPEAFQRSREFFKANIPNQQKRLQFYLGERSLFSDYGIENQIEQLSSNHVSLPSGGSLVIDPTEALVAIDVNSGRYDQGNNIEYTALRTNVEAAEEVARQLRLRNLGGLIVIDFIDMVSEENQNTVIKTLEEYLQDDKAKWTLGGISQFGLLEMSRQRIANALSQETKTTCPTCGGMGEVLSISSLANAVLRKIRDLAATGEVVEISSRVPVELSNYLFNKKRQQLDELEVEFGMSIFLRADLSVDSGKLPNFDVKYKKGTKTFVEEEHKKNQGDFKNKSKKSPSSHKRGRGMSQNSEDEVKPREHAMKPDEAELSKDSEHAPEPKDNFEETAEAPASNTESQKSKVIPLFSSVHQPPPANQVLPLIQQVDDTREKLKDIPPGTTLFSSSHREPQEPSTESSAPVPPVEEAEQKTAKCLPTTKRGTSKKTTSPVASEEPESQEEIQEEVKKTTRKKSATTRSPKPKSAAKAKPKTAAAKTALAKTPSRSKTTKTAAKKSASKETKEKEAIENKIDTQNSETSESEKPTPLEKKEKTTSTRKRATSAKSAKTASTKAASTTATKTMRTPKKATSVAKKTSK